MKKIKSHLALFLNLFLKILFQIHTEWPSKLRSKGVFFVKKELTKIPDPDMECLKNFMICGDIHANVLGINET